MNRFPDNKRFAFTVFDDTDRSNLENTQPVYRLLAELGVLTTKSVWPLKSEASVRNGESTLQDKDYLNFVTLLKSYGFEIGLHSVQNHDSTRAVVEHGFEQFQELVGQYPRTHCNHKMNRDNLYWGANRLETVPVRFAYNLVTRRKRQDYFMGHVKDSPYFWGDICRERISYVRNFVFDEINLDRINPTMPYHDPGKPFINFWFSSSEGDTVETFCKMISEANQDRLEAEGGVCIMYTHFAAGFFQGGRLHQNFERLIRRLAKKNAWFVPVATLLDHLRKSRINSEIPRRELTQMERRWFLSKLHKGTS